uniref:C2H2-type domain-containing protein n=1 Tax=Clastoptera arizonana TaxID=38151 RepID=A0A1B6D1I3_9HEMI
MSAFSFICGYCDKVTKDKKSIQRHQLYSHHGETELIFDSKGDIINSTYSISESEKINNIIERTCNQDIEYDRESVLKLQYNCFYCKLDGSLCDLQTHCLEKHSNFKVEMFQYKYKCLETGCSTYLNSISCMVFHFNMKHVGLNYNFIKLKTLPEMNNLKLEGPGVVFKCPRCKVTKKLLKNLNQHLRKHFINYCCTVCEKEYKSFSTVKNHALFTHKLEIKSSEVYHNRSKDCMQAKKEIICIQEYSSVEENNAPKDNSINIQNIPSVNNSNNVFSEEISNDQDFRKIESKEQKDKYVCFLSNGKRLRLPSDVFKKIFKVYTPRIEVRYPKIIP